MDDNVVAALAVTCIFGLPVVGFIVMRVLAHRERIEMIRRGMMPPSFFGSRPNREWFAHNIGMPPPPQAPPPPPPPYAAWTPQPPDLDFADRSLRKGIMLAVIGLAITIGLSFIGYSPHGGAFNAPSIEPGPWLLGGLIPMFVGVAQIIIALLSGARLGPPQTNRYGAPPPPPFGAPPPPPPPSSNAEPGVHTGFQELQRPAPPPDRR